MKNILISGATGFIGQRLFWVMDAYIRVLSCEKKPVYEAVVCNLESEAIPDNALDGVDTVFYLAGFANDPRDATKIQNIYQKVDVDALIRLAKLDKLLGDEYYSSAKLDGLGFKAQKALKDMNETSF